MKVQGFAKIASIQTLWERIHQHCIKVFQCFDVLSDQFPPRS